MTILPEDLIKVLLSILAGGLIGLEREYRDKAAGFRTIIFICVGSALFTILSVKIAGDKDPGRVAANIVTGVGFLGAGVLLRDGGRVLGLTTASIIWLTAAIGMGIGSGQYVLAGATAVVMMIVLWFFPGFEHWIDNAREERMYEVVLPLQLEKCEQIESAFKQCRLRVMSRKRIKSGEEMICIWDVFGSPKNHTRFTETLFADPDVKSFKF